MTQILVSQSSQILASSTLYILLQLNKKIGVAQRGKGAKPLQKEKKMVLNLLPAASC